MGKTVLLLAMVSFALGPLIYLPCSIDKTFGFE